MLISIVFSVYCRYIWLLYLHLITYPCQKLDGGSANTCYQTRHLEDMITLEDSHVLDVKSDIVFN